MGKKYTKQELIAWTGRREGLLIHQLSALSENDRLRTILSRDTGQLRSCDIEDTTPLHYAAAVGNPETVSLLLAYGAQVNSPNMHEETPLLWSLIEPRTAERRAKISLLIKANARINHANTEGETALHQSFRDNQVTHFLLKHGANVSARNIHEWTPLHYASLFDDFIESTRYLLAFDADPNAPDDEGLTPLHLTVQNNSIHTAALLLFAGANRQAKDKNGLTPYDTAEELDAPEELIQLLK